MGTSKVSPNTGNLSMPRGRLSFAYMDDDEVMKGEIDLGNVTSLEVTQSHEWKEHMTSHDDQVFLDDKQLAALKMQVKFTPEERSKENMAMFFFSDPEKQKGASPNTFEQTLGTKTALAATIYLDRWIDLGYKYIKEGSIVIHNGGDVTVSDMTSGTYAVDYENGLLMIKSTNTESLTDDEDVTIDFDYGTCSLPEFPADFKPIRGMLRYRGLSEIGPRHEVVFWKVQINPDAALSLIKTNDYAGLSFTGDVFKDDATGDHGDYPFYRVQELSAATEYPS